MTLPRQNNQYNKHLSILYIYIIIYIFYYYFLLLLNSNKKQSSNTCKSYCRPFYMHINITGKRWVLHMGISSHSLYRYTSSLWFKIKKIKNLVNIVLGGGYPLFRRGLFAFESNLALGSRWADFNSICTI